MRLRIVTYKDKFKIEYKSWFFGWLTLGESEEIEINRELQTMTNDCIFSTVEEAEEYIQERFFPKKEKVIKEIKV